MPLPPAPRVLVIAATDSSGGAGLTRDLQTLTAWRTEACCAVTAVTAQTRSRVLHIEPLPAERVVEQMRAALDALDAAPVGAIKIGMLATAATVRAIARELPARVMPGAPTVPAVLDPVLVSSSGTELLTPEGIEALRRELLPRVLLVTPNLPEAAALLQCPLAHDEATMLEQMRALRELGAAAVLLKGGHEPAAADGQVTDRLLRPDGQLVRLRIPRAAAQRRGTGCSAASAIAAQLAAGIPLEAACAAAQAYVAAALRGDPWQPFVPPAPALQPAAPPR